MATEQNSTHTATAHTDIPWRAGKPFKRMPEHAGIVFPIYTKRPRCPSCGNGGSEYLIAHLYANAVGKVEAKEAQETIVRAVNCHNGMLEALIAADGLLRELGYSLPQVKAVLAKAEGRS